MLWFCLRSLIFGKILAVLVCPNCVQCPNYARGTTQDIHAMRSAKTKKYSGRPRAILLPVSGKRLTKSSISASTNFHRRLGLLREYQTILDIVKLASSATHRPQLSGAPTPFHKRKKLKHNCCRDGRAEEI